MLDAKSRVLPQWLLLHTCQTKFEALCLTVEMQKVSFLPH